MGMELLSDLHTCVVPEAFLLFTNRYSTPSMPGPYRSSSLFRQVPTETHDLHINRAALLKLQTQPEVVQV